MILGYGQAAGGEEREENETGKGSNNEKCHLTKRDAAIKHRQV